MFSKATISLDMARQFIMLDLENSDSLFVWSKSGNGESCVMLRKDAAQENIIAPAFTANEMSRALSFICREIEQFFSLSIGNQISNIANDLAESIIEAIQEEVISVDKVKEIFKEINLEDLNSKEFSRYSKKAHAEMFAILKTFLKANNAGVFNNSKAILGDWVLLGNKTETESKDIIVVRAGKNKLLTVVKDKPTEAPDIIEGNDTILAKVANQVVRVNSIDYSNIANS